MMTLSTAYSLLLCVSCTGILCQLFLKHKTLAHVFFALFCGSLAVIAIQYLSADILGPFKYLLGIGTCLTCNGIWLVARALFAGDKAIEPRHIVFAGLIALLVIINQGLNFSYGLEFIDIEVSTRIKVVLTKITSLLSSTVLALTFWEAAKGFRKQSTRGKVQRTLFLSAFSCGFLACSVVLFALHSPENISAVKPWYVVIAATTIIIATQICIWLNPSSESAPEAQESIVEASDQTLLQKLDELIINECTYLQSNLKIIDLANKLAVSEYKISRAIRAGKGKTNFNQYINGFRIEHAKALLINQDSHSWPILVVALESGFASLASFNRVFKSVENCSPSQYRNRHHHETKPQLEKVVLQ